MTAHLLLCLLLGVTDIALGWQQREDYDGQCDHYTDYHVQTCQAMNNSLKGLELTHGRFNVHYPNDVASYGYGIWKQPGGKMVKNKPTDRWQTVSYNETVAFTAVNYQEWMAYGQVSWRMQLAENIPGKAPLYLSYMYMVPKYRGVYWPDSFLAVRVAEKIGNDRGISRTLADAIVYKMNWPDDYDCEYNYDFGKFKDLSPEDCFGDMLLLRANTASDAKGSKKLRGYNISAYLGSGNQPDLKITIEQTQSNCPSQSWRASRVSPPTAQTILLEKKESAAAI